MDIKIDMTNIVYEYLVWIKIKIITQLIKYILSYTITVYYRIKC